MAKDKPIVDILRDLHQAQEAFDLLTAKYERLAKERDKLVSQLDAIRAVIELLDGVANPRE